MPGKGAFVILAFLAITTLHFGNPGSPAGRLVKLYHQADSLLNLYSPTDATNNKALAGFEEVIRELEKNPLPNNDTLLFLCYRNKGILMEIKADYSAARDAYGTALQLKEIKNTPVDSLILMTYINIGSTFYNLNNFDSASYFLLKAESMMTRFPDIEYKVRLYNTLGVLYHDNGNYLQCKNYFSQALEIIKSKKPFDTISAVSIEINIATSYSRLGLYEDALSSYKKILRYDLFSGFIYMNMGRANISLNRHNEALACFRKVNTNQLPWVFNEIGFTHLQLKQYDSAAWYLNQLHFKKNESNLSVADKGINKLYFAELHANQQHYLPALDSLQQAIIIFSGNFKNPNIYSNPSGFSGTFAYYRLFSALSKKALVFELLYKQTRKEEYLLASLNTYNSTLSLLSYIEKSYDTDDAKLLLKKKSRNVYQEALLVCLELYHLHPESNYLEQAFLINEKNKASVIVSSLKERTFTTVPGVEEKLLKKERNIKYNIARLNIQSDQAMDSNETESIASEKANYEIELTRLQKTFEQNSHFYKLKYDDSYPGIKELREQIDTRQALISFYTTDSTLHAFVITRNSFTYIPIDSFKSIEKDITAWLNLLRNVEGGRRFNGEKIGSRLYNHLIKPIKSAIPGKDEWVIIPDGILHYLPFESLPGDEDLNPLVETIATSYQFSSRFITQHSLPLEENNESVNLIAFAPFTRKGTDFNRPGFALMNPLPQSGDEIAGLNGIKYFDSQATKNRFLKELNKYAIIHLATHAVSENNGSAPFIAFHPQKNSLIEDCLFLEELYGLNMDSTKLVIISACETGNGELVNSEGVMSLSRAFVYAGCPSTINSLWKADDKATSSILKQFHIYLREGYSKSKALQQAKLDYIKSNALYKSPTHWAHLVLMGNIEPVFVKKQPYVWVALILFSLCAFLRIIVGAKRN